MINLEKELAKKTEARKEESGALENVKEVKLLLAGNDAREVTLLKSFGLADVIVEVEKRRGESLQLENITAEYGTSFHIKDIKQLAIDYNLKFLPLDLYNGAIDPLLASKILAFCDKHDIDSSNIAHSNSFFVLAPYDTFKLEDNLHTKPAPRPIVSLDPLLFYKSDRHEEVWTFVYKWGKDFTISRAISAMKYVNISWWFWSKLALFIPIFCLVLPFIGKLWTHSFLYTFGVAVAAGMIFSLLAMWIRDSSRHNNFVDYFTGDNYRSRKNRIHREV